MTKEKEKIPEFIDEKEVKSEKSGKRKASIRDIIDGSIITHSGVSNQLPFFLFIVFIAAMYIGNRYHAEKVYRDLVRIDAEVKDLRAESITTASELMFISKQSEVVRLVKEQGLELEESLIPPIKIKKY